jgi:hypothetical protein
MKTLARAAFWTAVLGLGSLCTANGTGYSDFLANADSTGQEYQHDIACCAHGDGAWTAAWLDFRAGVPCIFARDFSSSGEPLGPGRNLTDGHGLFGVDLNAAPVGEPALTPLSGNQSLVVWTEVRSEENRVRAAIIDPEGILAGPVTVNDTARRSECRHPRAAEAGDRFFLVWTESPGIYARVYGQVLDRDLRRQGGNRPLHADLNEPQNDPAVVKRGEGWLVAWSEGDPTFQAAVCAFDLGGAPIGAPRRVDPDPAWSQRDLSMVAVTGGYFLTWTATQANLVTLVARQLGEDLDPAGASVSVYPPEPGTVTPGAPELLPGAAGSVLVIWPAGPASRRRLHSRSIELPDTPTGDVILLDDPPDPVDGVLIPQSLAVCGGEGVQRRIAWWDNREGWDLCYSLRIDEAGRPAWEGPAPIEMADGTASQVLPATALYPDGNGIVVWEDFLTGGLSIFARRLDRDGAPLGEPFRVSAASTGSVAVPADNLRDLLRNQPSVATTKSGSTLVAWTKLFTDGRSRVFLQSYDATGARLGGNEELPTVRPDAPSPNTQGTPTVVRMSDGGTMVIWRDTYADPNGDIFGRRFLADGTAASDTIRIVDPGPYVGASQDTPAAASSGEGEVVVAWLDGRSGDGDIYVQRLGPTGRRIEKNILVSGIEEESPVPQRNPAVAAAPGRYVAVWDDNPLGVGVISGVLTILPSQKGGSAARSVDIPINISTGHLGTKYPRVAMNPDGRFVVTFWDTSSDSARVMAQRFSPDGIKIGVPYSVSTLGGRSSSIPGGVAGNGNRIQYSFSDARDVRGWDVRVRRVDWTFDGEYSGIALAGWFIEQDDDALVLRWSVPLDRAGSLYTVWRESVDGEQAGDVPGSAAERVGAGPVGPTVSGGADYLFRDAWVDPGQRVAYWIEDPDGEFAGPWSGMRGASSVVTELRALGNPFRGSARLAWMAPRGAQVEIAIHDASGRRVRDLLRSSDVTPEGAGGRRGETAWDGRDDAGRPVPTGVYWARLRTQPGSDRTIQLLRLR